MLALHARRRLAGGGIAGLTPQQRPQSEAAVDGALRALNAAGRGDGPVAQYPSKAPPDLTTCAKRNGGSFPTQLAWQAIDGRPVAIGAHGTAGMPVCSREFRRGAAAGGGAGVPGARSAPRSGAGSASWPWRQRCGVGSG